ncbi:MAG: hypothetical protein GY777_16500 [Candidatus Brocadiaceae bacterium]|nr:hypothetical protein [Candidatus Brocadiaceae bacterium]
MTRKCSKYFYMFTITMISLSLFNAGCSNQPKRTEVLDTKMDSLSQSVEGLEPQISKLKKELDAQVAEIDALLNSQGNAHNLLESRVSETGNTLREITQKLNSIEESVEEDKGDTKAQLDELKIQLNQLEATSRISESDTNFTEELLDNGIKFYMQQKFEEAISKWEEVLARNPGRLEAKFFIEIAKDRIKQAQIHEDLKALLIQRE